MVYTVGQIIEEAKVVNIREFGVFVEIDSSLTGLIHFSQIIPKVGYGNISTVLSVGDRIRCAVSEVKPDGKVNLTMKIRKRIERKRQIEKVKKDIANMSNEDTSLRSIWMVLTNIQHYMLKYMQLAIPLKKGSASLNPKGNKLTALIDSQIHFDNFKSEIRRLFSADVVSHSLLPGFCYFETDVDLCSNMQQFVDSCSNMYVSVRPNPVVEIQIKDADEASKKIIKTRLQNYYSQLDFFEINDNLMVVTVPYENRAALEDLKEELGYALNGIRNGVPDSAEEGEQTIFDPARFVYDINYPQDGADRFLLTRDNEALLDKEGLRFGGLYGQSFIIKDGENEYKLGKLSKIEYPNVAFNLLPEDCDKIKEMIENDCITAVIPDMDDMTGEIEKVNRLRDSFDRITEHPEDLVNPQLASYLFDASKATRLEDEVIEQRVEQIKKCQLNESLNESQIQAIAKAVEAKDLAIVQGPPGTGKSTAIAELIWQLAQQKPDSRMLLTSEANLAVDNALDRLKFSVHNIVKPIRVAAGDKFSAEGFAYSQVEMKKWAGIKLSDIDTEDNTVAIDTDEYKSFNPQELVLNRWMKNIYKRSQLHLQREDLKRLWFDFLSDLPSEWRKEVYQEYVSHCNVIGATCSSISDTNYSATEAKGKHRDSRFIKRFRAIFGETEKNGYPVFLRFNTVIQDEASKATPAELSLPLVYGEKAVVIGDHRQLPPNLDREDVLFKLHMQKLKADSREEHDQIEQLESYVRKNFDILEKSHFERLFRQIDLSLRGTFDTQYRMHNDINRVIEQFYVDDGGLKCGVANESRGHGIDIPNFISPDNHVIWINTSSPEVRDGTSRANRGETEAIEWVLSQLSKSESFRSYQESQPTNEDREIGLITFYGSQLKRLKGIVEKETKKGLSIKMSSVDRFQGMERNIIIVSMVRSNSIAQKWGQKPDYNRFPNVGYPAQKEYGFAKSPNRLNVALSRAKRLLIIVGNGEHFSNYTNPQGQAIYKNVFDEVKNNPNGRIIEWSVRKPKQEHVAKIVRVPMPIQRSVNLNTRDINAETDKNLRIKETWLTPDGHPVDNPHFAVLELSTKAVKLLIGRDEETIRTATRFDFNNFIRDAAKPETGKGLDSQNVMNMEYFRGRVLPVIRRMKQKMRSEGVDVVYTVATAAYRTAKNRDEVIECIRREAGINVRILSKKEESVSTMFAYGISSRYKLEIQKSKHSVMVDQGGGSTEVSVFNQGELEGSYSINLGTTALRNILTKDIPPTTLLVDAFKKSDQMLRERMVAFTKNMNTTMQTNEDTFCVSVGSAITHATGKKNNASQHDSILNCEQIAEKIDNLTARLQEKFNTVGDLVRWEQQMTGDAIDDMLTLRMGLPMYLLLMERFNIKQIHVCGTGLWYGIYLQHLFNIAD